MYGDIKAQRRSAGNIKIKVELEYQLDPGQKVSDLLAENADEVINAVVRAANYADWECSSLREW